MALETGRPFSDHPLSGKTHLVRRALAFVVDYGIFLAANYQYGKYFGEPHPFNPDLYRIPVSHAFVLFAAWCAWFPIMEAVFGFTLGKGLFDLKVVTSRGLKADALQVIQRRLLDPIDFACCMFVPGILTVILTPYGQRLGDLWGKTIVTHESELTNEEPA